MDSLETIIEKRRADIREWMQDPKNQCVKDQKHLDEGSTERAYWNYGYETALKDVLALLGNASTPKH